MSARGRGSTLAALVATGLVAGGCLPAPVTTEGRRTAEVYTTFVAVAAVVAVVVIGLSVFAIIRYRARGDDTLPRQVVGNTRLEAIWTGIPLLTVAVLFGLTVLVLNGFDDATRASASVEIRVTAYRWGWRFEYPAEGVRVEGIGKPGPEAYVPVGENVHLNLTGVDVIHAFFVPQFLFKKDAVPGRTNSFAFTVDTPGRYGGQCAEFCGIYHSQMPFTIVAVTRAEYDAWLAANKGPGTSGGSGAPGPSPEASQ
jgi:cytochrome c oxidase subunit 2